MAPFPHTLVALLAALAGAACAGGNDGGTGRAGVATGPGPSGTVAGLPRVVVVGASDAVGYGADDPATDAWPQVLARTALPAGATLVNLGIAGATVAVALAEELPAALAADATVVLVWLSVNDLVAQVPVDTYEAQLRRLVGDLRRGGSRVLVGNAPPLDRLPISLSGADGAGGADGAAARLGALDQAVGAYNAAVARVVAAEGADLVDLHAAALAARAAGTEASLVSEDGFHPSTAGHGAIAAAFAEVLARR